jgi:membrane fusion protein, multidrug efflux system
MRLEVRAGMSRTEAEAAMNRASSPRWRGWIAPVLVLATVLTTGGVLAAWKIDSFDKAAASAASQPEPSEVVRLSVAAPREHRPIVTAIGTVLATRSVTLRNELAGTVREVALVPGQIVAAGTVLVRLDVSVELAEMEAEQVRAHLAQTLLDRSQQARQDHAVSEIEVDRARAERDVARAQIARTRAIIERKTLRAPFPARVGLSDLHVGQYLDEGTVVTTLQGIGDEAHVDFAVAQGVARGLKVGDRVRVFPSEELPPIPGTIVAIDARVDPATRNASVRARIEESPTGPAPGAAVRVEVPAGAVESAVVVPVTALRKGPAGDHVFVVAPDEDGRLRAHARPVESGPVLEDEVLVLSGLAAGEQVASAGSFKLREAALVAVVTE